MDALNHTHRLKEEIFGPAERYLRKFREFPDGEWKGVLGNSLCMLPTDKY